MIQEEVGDIEGQIEKIVSFPLSTGSFDDDRMPDCLRNEIT
jgi:hypothetical protein